MSQVDRVTAVTPPSAPSTSPSATARPRLQVALDTTTLPAALGPLQKAAEHIEVIEVGTVLCLSEGMHAVRAIRALFPDKTILADIRIAEAGAILSRLAFEAGADWVSVVAGASLTTVEQVVKVAAEFGGEVQIELSDDYDADQARRWRELGAQHVIVHRSRDAEAAGELSWHADDLARIDELADMGFTVTITGGVTAADLPTFEGRPVGVVIAGRAIVAADDPYAAATTLADSITKVWP
jgi:3-dehydro-L-gulonate-6-phosphate decarboxylase